MKGITGRMNTYFCSVRARIIPELKLIAIIERIWNSNILESLKKNDNSVCQFQNRKKIKKRRNIRGKFCEKAYKNRKDNDIAAYLYNVFKTIHHTFVECAEGKRIVFTFCLAQGFSVWFTMFEIKSSEKRN